jgi:cytochrome c
LDCAWGRRVRCRRRPRRAGQRRCGSDDEKDGCAACHEIDKKLIGPAFQDVAVKYKGDKDAAAKLRDKVKKGGTHVWGEAAMPPNVLASDADIKDLVDWILTLKK